MQGRPPLAEGAMSIKSDKWIRRMAEQHGMIEPFEPGQVRRTPTARSIVSYGTSSYGYDIRCAPEFKVFTNIHSTVVDPKNFDERASSTSRPTSASSRPTASRWRARWSTSASRATC
jgi:deoxycytidine triphosphate deaminase